MLLEVAMPGGKGGASSIRSFWVLDTLFQEFRGLEFIYVLHHVFVPLEK